NKMADYPTTEELQKSIEWAIKQGGNDNYLLNDYFYPVQGQRSSRVHGWLPWLKKRG
ncbi:unnamed protein product, partial [marine sediment metagenome]